MSKGRILVEAASAELTLREGERMLNAMLDGNVLILGGIGSGKTGLVNALREKASSSRLPSVTLDPMGFSDGPRVDNEGLLDAATEMARNRTFYLIAIDHAEGVDFREPENSRALARLFEEARKAGVIVAVTSAFSPTGTREDKLADTCSTVALMDPFGRSKHVCSGPFMGVAYDLRATWERLQVAWGARLPVGPGWMLSFTADDVAYGKVPMTEGR